jgi:putative oxidoreductase
MSLTNETGQGAATGGLAGLIGAVHRAFAAIPDWFVAIIARISIAAVFWKSGQTKVEGFAIDLVEGTFQLGMPKLGALTVDLFRDEYKLPLLSPELAAILATIAEHVFPVLILIGLATRLSAFALLVMTIVIQVFVYPSAYALHGTWAVVLLFLMAKGPGWLSLDHLIARRG